MLVCVTCCLCCAFQLIHLSHLCLILTTNALISEECYLFKQRDFRVFILSRETTFVCLPQIHKRHRRQCVQKNVFLAEDGFWSNAFPRPLHTSCLTNKQHDKRIQCLKALKLIKCHDDEFNMILCSEIHEFRVLQAASQQFLELVPPLCHGFYLHSETGRKNIRYVNNSPLNSCLYCDSCWKGTAVQIQVWWGAWCLRCDFVTISIKKTAETRMSCKTCSHFANCKISKIF